MSTVSFIRNSSNQLWDTRVFVKKQAERSRSWSWETCAHTQPPYCFTSLAGYSRFYSDPKRALLISRTSVIVVVFVFHQQLSCCDEMPHISINLAIEQVGAGLGDAVGDSLTTCVTLSSTLTLTPRLMSFETGLCTIGLHSLCLSSV